jgi:hypothetical protein
VRTFFDICDARHAELPVLLAHAQQHHAAMRIGHRRISRPEILGQFALAILPLRQFAFQRDRFGHAGEVGQRVQRGR